MTPSLTCSALTANVLYRDVLQLVIERGEPVYPRGRGTLEVRGASLTLERPRMALVTTKERNLSLPYAAAEALWILLGREDVETLAPFNKRISDFSDDGRVFFGAYGPRLLDQLGYVLSTLREDRSSRQAVATLWRPIPPKTKDVPCTVALQFMIRDDALEMTTFMRSNDVWLGLPYDLFTFTTIQRYVAAQLDLYDVGPYRHLVGSLHLYHDNLTAAEKVTNAGVGHMLIEPPLLRLGPEQLEYLDQAFSDMAHLVKTGEAARARLLTSAVAQHVPEWAPLFSLLAARLPENLDAIRDPYREVTR